MGVFELMAKIGTNLLSSSRRSIPFSRRASAGEKMRSFFIGQASPKLPGKSELANVTKTRLTKKLLDDDLPLLWLRHNLLHRDAEDDVVRGMRMPVRHISLHFPAVAP